MLWINEAEYYRNFVRERGERTICYLNMLAFSVFTFASSNSQIISSYVLSVVNVIKVTIKGCGNFLRSYSHRIALSIPAH